jgi:hypothetical protein
MREGTTMGIHVLGGVLCVLVLLGGCATPPLPGAAGEISGPLRSIELYTKKPEPGELYGTAARNRLFASDREVWVLLHWGLPKPGSYIAKAALRTPTGTLHGEREYRFEAKDSLWVTVHLFTLPPGEEAQRLTGPWQIEAALGDATVGHRTFTFDPSSIRLRTDARVVILQGADDPDAASGDWTWLNRGAALEQIKAAHAILGIVLRNELARRFPRVEGPRQPSAESEATILVRTKFRISPNPDTDARLTVDVVRPPAQTGRTFLFRSSAGVELMGGTRNRNVPLAAMDLAFQAAANPEVLAFLMTATKAVPE